MARSLGEQVRRYEEMAELFRRLTLLDEHSLGPELARLQSIAATAPPRRFGLHGRIQSLLLASVTPVLGKVLKLASLASPYQAAYELAVQMQERQLEIEGRICAELAALNSRIDELESDLNTQRRSA